MNFESCFICITLVLSTVHGNHVEKFYRNPNNITTTEYTETVRSKLECAAKCKAKNKCHSFLFDKRTNACIMSRGLADYTSNTRYRAAKCEHNIRYTYVSQLNLCFRIEEETVHTLTQIKQICESEGAHLVVIENQEIDQFLTDLILTSDSFKTSDRFYIDGNDKVNEDEWKTVSGKTLTYFNWGGNDPNGGRSRNCLALLKMFEFQWGDTLCNSADLVGGFICQIDV